MDETKGLNGKDEARPSWDSVLWRPRLGRVRRGKIQRRWLVSSGCPQSRAKRQRGETASSLGAENEETQGKQKRAKEALSGPRRHRSVVHGLGHEMRYSFDTTRVGRADNLARQSDDSCTVDPAEDIRRPRADGLQSPQVGCEQTDIFSPRHWQSPDVQRRSRPSMFGRTASRIQRRFGTGDPDPVRGLSCFRLVPGQARLMAESGVWSRGRRDRLSWTSSTSIQRHAERVSRPALLCCTTMLHPASSLPEPWTDERLIDGRSCGAEPGRPDRSGRAVGPKKPLTDVRRMLPGIEIRGFAMLKWVAGQPTLPNSLQLDKW